MCTKIKFQNNNRAGTIREYWDDTEWISEFYEFLQGDVPEGIRIARGHQPKMSQKKAMTIIWYLQEHLNVLPSNIEKCSDCGHLFDSHSEGLYWESKAKHFCDSCSCSVPENYDRGKR